MKFLVGKTLTVRNPAVRNQVGGTVFIDAVVQVKVKSTFYDYETGHRFIGELFRREDISLSRKVGKSMYSPENHKEGDPTIHESILTAYREYNPAIVYFSEYDIVNKTLSP